MPLTSKVSSGAHYHTGPLGATTRVTRLDSFAGREQAVEPELASEAGRRSGKERGSDEAD